MSTQRHPTLPRTSVAVLLGGPSAEHDVSLVSGRAIAAALSERGHDIQAWLIDLDGGWWLLPNEALDAVIEPVAYDDPIALGARERLGAATALEGLAAMDPRPVVFPALHGPFGEDGTIQALAWSVGLVCCGSGTAASAVGMDKTLFKRICVAIDVPVLPWIEVRARDWQVSPTTMLDDLGRFAAEQPDQRLVVKPARLGSSVGISIVHAPDDLPRLRQAVEHALRFDDLVLAEPYLDHPRELEAAVLGDVAADLEVYGPGEVLPGREFYDFVAKYRFDGSTSDLTPDLDPDLAAEVRRIAAAGFTAIGASGFARVDFLLSRDGLLFVSEINTIPGFTPISLFPRLCELGGYDFGGVCERIVTLALEREASVLPRGLTRAELP